MAYLEFPGESKSSQEERLDNWVKFGSTVFYTRSVILTLKDICIFSVSEVMLRKERLAEVSIIILRMWFTKVF